MSQVAVNFDDLDPSQDPWNYRLLPDDDNRKAILLSELPRRDYQNVLSIGCGAGFITKDLPGKKVLGIDISPEAISAAKQLSNERVKFQEASIFDLPSIVDTNLLNSEFSTILNTDKFDLIVITGVLYPSHIGQSLNLIYLLVDKILSTNGIVASAHINDQYHASFPYLLLKSLTYNCHDLNHLLEIYVK